MVQSDKYIITHNNNQLFYHESELYGLIILVIPYTREVRLAKKYKIPMNIQSSVLTIGTCMYLFAYVFFNSST